MLFTNKNGPKLWSIILLAIICLFAKSYSQSITKEQIQLWTAGIKSALFIPNPLPQLDLKKHGTFQPAQGVVIEKVTYNSLYGLRIPAIIYRPKEQSAKLPGIVIVNGHGGDKYSWYSFYSGILYAQAGAVVITFDPVGEGERNINKESGTRAHDTRLAPKEMARRMGGTLIADVMQAVSCLLEREEIDSSRIAVMGYSLGSFLVSITGAIDPRIKACVLVGGGNIDGPNGYWDNSKPMCQGIPYQSLQFLGDRPATIYAMHAQRGPTLVYNGLADSVVAIPTMGEAFFKDVQERTSKLLGTNNGVFETRFEIGTSHRPYFVIRDVALWLEEKIDFPNWTQLEIKSMGQTHISEWAAAHNVEMDRQYATESREGGVRALGTGIPALAREVLCVFSNTQWEQKKEKFIYESWVLNARKHLSK